MTETQTIKSSKQFIKELLKNLHPECDLEDEEILFGLICDDYEEYARLIESREADIVKAQADGELKGRNARIEQLMQQRPDSDGIPNLGGANTTYHNTPSSIFSIAKGAN